MYASIASPAETWLAKFGLWGAHMSEFETEQESVTYRIIK